MLLFRNYCPCRGEQIVGLTNTAYLSSERRRIYEQVLYLLIEFILAHLDTLCDQGIPFHIIIELR